jgi:hypothetical protein
MNKPQDKKWDATDHAVTGAAVGALGGLAWWGVRKIAEE